MNQRSLPLVSVLMTAYNREKYIGEAIDSILASTYTNFELIIVDDGSADNTVAIAREYAAREPRIAVYVNDRNLGDYHNRNKAASYATGKYIKYVDSDDLIYPDSLGIFVAAMERFPEAAVGIMSTICQDDRPYPFQLSPKEAYQYHFFTKGLFDTGPSALIFRADRFREIGGFSGKRFVGDVEINLRLAARWPVIKTASSLVFWRQHEGQEFVAGWGSTGYLEWQLPVHQTELGDPCCPMDQATGRRIVDYFKRVSGREIIKLALLQKKPGLARSMYRKLGLSPLDLIRAVLVKRKY